MFKLRLQFFIVMLAISSLLTAGLYVFIKFSFKQDFWHYIEKKETRFAQPLMTDLIQHYREHKNWQGIENWDDYIFQSLDLDNHERNSNTPESGTNNQFNRSPENRVNEPNKEAHSEHDSERHEERREERPKGEFPNARAFREWREFKRRPPIEAIHAIFLLDEKHRLIAGNNQRPQDAFLLELNLDDNTIGYLGIPFNPALRDLQDANFAQVQEKKLAVVIVIALIIASMASFPLAHLLTQRINILVNQVTHLSRGNYHEKISIKGRDELSVLAEHLNNLGETLAQTEQTRRQWVADISHELRTPIAVLQAELEAMEDGVRPIDLPSIERLSKHSQRLKRIVNDLYELSLTDLGGMTYRKNTMDLNLLLQDAINTMQPQFVEQNIALTLNTAQTPISIFGDQHRLQQLFTNLLKNSLQYTNAPGKTQVSLKVENQQAVIVIEDTSPGVATEHHPKLFDRLYRADSSRNRATGGAGLGLSICKNIVTAHDGQIMIGNSQLGGLKITISIPC